MSRHDGLGVIEEQIRAEVVVAAGLRLRPATDEQIAFSVVDALEAGGFEIVRKAPRDST